MQKRRDTERPSKNFVLPSGVRVPEGLLTLKTEKRW